MEQQFCPGRLSRLLSIHTAAVTATAHAVPIQNDLNGFSYFQLCRELRQFVSTLSPWFLWPIKGFGVLLVLFTTLYAFVKTPVLFILTKEKLCVIGLLFAFYCTLGLTANFNGYVSNFINFLSVAGLVCLNRENKIELLTFISKGFAGIVLVSFLCFVMTFASGLSFSVRPTFFPFCCVSFTVF